ncbi:hypothetical protein AX15_002771 [Amanita polypyramis BW_CC]|nr:hypothetical protein AX15_002771 [Amanita polypyramis BW_CC]
MRKGRGFRVPLWRRYNYIIGGSETDLPIESSPSQDTLLNMAANDGKNNPAPVLVTAHSSSDHRPARRPAVDYSSPTAFFKTLGARWKSVWTRRFILSLLSGQVVSLCITCTNVTTTELVNRGLSFPAMQNDLFYLSLFLIFTPYTVYRYGLKGWGNVILRDGWKYFILAACDVEGNFFAIKAYSYTDLLTCMLLDAWVIPVCLFFSWLYLKPKYHWTQFLGVLISIGGLGLLVTCDVLTGKNWRATDKAKGSAFIFAAATLYGFANATEEFFVRKRPLYEVVGQLGMFGFIICGVQGSVLEYNHIKSGKWDGATASFLLAYSAAMLILYTIAPVLYRLASSTYLNMSILSSNFYSLLFGLFLFHYRPYWLYFISFAVILIGLVTYFWTSSPEEQGALDPEIPTYVTTAKAKRFEQSESRDRNGDEVVVASLADV